VLDRLDAVGVGTGAVDAGVVFAAADHAHVFLGISPDAGDAADAGSRTRDAEHTGGLQDP
jgi:hypothetical protein